MHISTLIPVACIAALQMLSPYAAAQTYPEKSVRIVVPYATGGGSDILARQIGAGLQKAWGQGVVVDNKAGASGNIGTQEVVRAPADGYTLLLLREGDPCCGALIMSLAIFRSTRACPVGIRGMASSASSKRAGPFVPGQRPTHPHWTFGYGWRILSDPSSVNAQPAPWHPYRPSRHRGLMDSH